MKFAMIWDYSAYVKSFYVKDGVAHTFEDNKPYMYTHAVSPECFLMGPGSFPFLWEDGCFINLWAGQQSPELWQIGNTLTLFRLASSKLLLA